MNNKTTVYNNNYKISIYLCLLFLISFIFRIYLLSQNLFFGPEQGIDFLVIKDLIINHKITLIGAKTDISGIFHGPIYYYTAALPFWLSKGNPLFISYFLIALNCVTVFFIYLLGKTLFNKRVALISPLLFTISFNAIVYSRWLSSHSLAIPLVCLYFFFIAKFLKGSKKSLLGASVTLGLVTQPEFLNILFFSVITVCVIIIYFKTFRKQNIFYLLLNLLISIILSVGSFVLFDLRHNFLISKNIVLLLKGNTGYHISFINSITSAFQAIGNLVTSTIIPFSLPLAVVIIITAIIFLIKEKENKQKALLFLWLFVPPSLLILLHHEMLDQFFVILIPAIILITAFLIDKTLTKTTLGGLGLSMLLLGFCVFAYVTYIPRNEKIFFQSTQLNLKYSDELQVIDTIYKEANHKPFSFQAYTIPYWSQQGWQYLFWFYGQSKYGYMPIDEKAKTLFVIIQTDPSNSGYQQKWLKDTVSKWGEARKEFRYGALKVRELKVVNQ